MTALQKITTTYSESEDRLRLAGQNAAGAEAVVLWLTQRLANRLVRTLTQWLESDAGTSRHALPGDLHHAWAQEVAVRQLQPSAPVSVNDAVPATLVESVDLSHNGQRFIIDFRRGDNSTTLQLSNTELRQWLGIVRTLYQTAEWPLDDWPTWMEESPRSRQRPALLH